MCFSAVNGSGILHSLPGSIQINMLINDEIGSNLQMETHGSSVSSVPRVPECTRTSVEGPVTNYMILIDNLAR